MGFIGDFNNSVHGKDLTLDEYIKKSVERCVDDIVRKMNEVKM